MEMDQGKLFIGGISWDTNEDRLKEYFGVYGDVIEALIMRDRATGRARGFGFIVFADPAVAEQVVKEKHTIDGRMVEAKKAVPRDDQHLINRISGSTQGSPGADRTKKIFVGGLPSTVTENDFKNYFKQFGMITDIVVMYDHNTQRPRGFGFITYDSEDAVDRVLRKTFHELNGKMVEVKRAVPKELSPGPSRSPVLGYNYGFSRTNNFLSNYSLASAHVGLSPFSSLGFGMGVNMDQGLNVGFGGGANFSNNIGFGRVLNPYISINERRYATPLGYNTSTTRGNSSVGVSPRNAWGNGCLNTSNNSGFNSYLGFGNGTFGVLGSLGANWGTSPIAPSLEVTSGFSRGNAGFRSGENSYTLGTTGFGRISGNGVARSSSFVYMNREYEPPYGDFYHGGDSGSVYGGLTWKTTSTSLGDSTSFGGYQLRNPENATLNESDDYGVSYDVPSNRQSSRGIGA